MNNIIRFNIDEKSLYRGTFNDFDKGHTPTVNTPINQSKDKSKWKTEILQLRKTNCKVSEDKITDRLMDLCLQSSKAESAIVTDLFVFNNVYVDNKKIDCNYQFAMYIKKETGESIKNKKGKFVKNTHLGRLKLHYPMSFIYKTDGFSIDNAKILDEIMKMNGGYAYIVRGFEYDCNEDRLNIITSLLGMQNIPLSIVFRVGKGTGKKLRINNDNITYDSFNIITIEKKNTQDGIDIEYETINKVRTENGKLGEEFVMNLLKEKLGDDSELYHTSKFFPESPYDIEYVFNGQKQYVEVKSTQGSKEVFNMSIGEYKFMEKYKDNYSLFVVTNVKDEFPQVSVYTYKKIMKLKKETMSFKFSA